MKKNMMFILSSIALLSSSFLAAQSRYSSNPQGSGMSPNYSAGYQSSNQYVGHQINWQSNYSDAVSMSQSSSKPIVILFTGTNWCPACMRLEKTVLNHPEFTQAVSQKFVFLKAEFNDYSEAGMMTSPYKPLLDRYGVNAFPTIVVINPNGQLLYTVNYRDGGPQLYAQELLQKLNQGETQYH
ncbi:MAG: thioredoxin family protein [Parachlamydiaceae bacterium]